MSLLLWQQVSLPTAEVEWIRPGGGNTATCSRIHSYGLEVLVPRTISLRPSLEVVVLVRASGGELPGGRGRVLGWWSLAAWASGHFYHYAELSDGFAESECRSRWLAGFPELRAVCCVRGESWEIRCLEAHVIWLEFLLGGV